MLDVNGDVDVQALVEQVRRSTLKSETAIQAVLDLSGQVTRIEVTCDEMARTVRKLSDQLAVLSATHSETRQKVRSLASIQDAPDDSPSHNHDLVSVRVRKDDKAAIMSAIAKAQELRTWRWLKSTGRAILIAAAALGVEQVVKALLRHL